MNTRKVSMILAMAAVLAAQTADMGVMLQRAIRMENVEGNLNSAIDLYKKVIAGATDRAIAAKALLGLGECYEKQGNSEAQKAYERLVKEFSDQAESARAAQARLTAMGQGRGDNVVAQEIARGPEFDLSGRSLKGEVTADGRFYVYVDAKSGNLAVRDLASGAVRRLTNDAKGVERGDAHVSSPVPSRDGKQVAFVWNLGTGSALDYPAQARVINIDGSGMHTISVKLKSDVQIAVKDWTPDGKSLLMYGAVPETVPALAWSAASNTAGFSAFGFSMVDIKTGEQRPIVRNFNLSNPKCLSADGRWIVYSRQVTQFSTNLAIYAIDTQTGQEKTVIDNGGIDRDPMWVPDSDRLVFRSDRKGASGIWMVRVRDGAALGAPVLIKQDAGEYTPLGITRDGAMFYGQSHVSSDVYGVDVDPVTLHAKGAPTIVVSTFPGRNTYPSWSPAGDSFAYYSEREGPGRSKLVVQHPEGKETVLSASVLALGWLPDWCGSDVLTEGGRLRHSLYNATTGEAQPERMIPRVTGGYQLTLSPDCSSAYVASHPTSQQRRIYRTEIATGKETDLLVDTGGTSISPLVSPDERWLALYGVLEGSHQNTVMLLPAQGGKLRSLDVDPMRGFSLTWTLDSKRLLLSRSVKPSAGEGEASELSWIPIEGGAPQPMGVRMSGRLSAPSLNRDGKRLVFSATETSNELWVLRNLPLK